MNTRPVLIGDIGGTNTRLAEAVAGRVENVRHYNNAEASGVEACLADYLASRGGAEPLQRAVLAVAGPVEGDVVTLTNRDWKISTAGLRADFAFEQAECINDFVALAYAVPVFIEGDVRIIGSGAPRPDAPALIIGPGTGFGAALWLPQGLALATEAGHSLLAASNDDEAELLDSLRSASGPVALEDVLSGAGLVKLHAALGGSRELLPEQVAAAAVSGKEPIATKALAMFFAFLGVAARNLALATGARGGVYLAGGILPRYAEALEASSFRARFETHAPLSGYLPQLATLLVTHPHPSLAGLAHYCSL